MKIIRAPREGGGFVIVPNTTARDERLTYRARGLLTVLLSYPDGWSTSADVLAESSPREGREAVRGAMSELESAGYFVRERINVGGGKFEWQWTVYDTPQDDVAAFAATMQAARRTTKSQVAPSAGLPSMDQPPTAKPYTVQPSTANPPSNEDPFHEDRSTNTEPRTPSSPDGDDAADVPQLTLVDDTAEPRQKTTRGCRVPDPFEITADMWAWVRGASPGVPDTWVRDNTERFVDYWRGVSGQRGCKADWPATWRNWLRKELDRRPAAADRFAVGYHHGDGLGTQAMTADEWAGR